MTWLKGARRNECRTITQEALNDYRSAIKAGLHYVIRSTYQLRLAALLDTGRKTYSICWASLRIPRERLAVLEWQTSAGAASIFMLTRLCWRVVLQAQRKLHERAWRCTTDVLAPFLALHTGLRAARKILRTARSPTNGSGACVSAISAAYKSIIDETGLTVDASLCAADKLQPVSPRHNIKVFLARL